MIRRHRPAFHPGRRRPVAVEFGASPVQAAAKLAAPGDKKIVDSESVAEPGGGARQRECGLGQAERRGRDGEAFEQPRDPPIMLQLLEHSEALPVLRMPQRMITLVSRKIPEIGQCSGDAPPISKLAESSQTLPIE